MLLHLHHGSKVPVMFATVYILVSLLQCQAFRKHLGTINGVCETLDVQHGQSPEKISSDSVQIRLTNNGEESSCYKPGTYYNVTIKSASLPIYGLLFLQVKNKIFGTFPYVDRERGRRLSLGLLEGPCSNAVSHKCIFNKYSDNDYYKRCNLGRTLELPFLAPEDRTKVVQFNYTIVFSMNEYLENHDVKFPACSCEGDCTTRVCDASEFQVRETTNNAPTICQKTRHISNEVRHVIEDGVNYTCVAAVRMNKCSTGCTKKEGKPLCCRVQLKKRLRNFMCTRSDSSTKITKKMEVTERRRCDCFFCKDVCPVVPAVDNSVEVEHDTEMGGNDVVDMSSSTEVQSSTTNSNTEVQSSTTNSDTEVQSSTTNSDTEVQSSTTNSDTEVQSSTSSEGGVNNSTTSSETVLDSV